MIVIQACDTDAPSRKPITLLLEVPKLTLDQLVAEIKRSYTVANTQLTDVTSTPHQTR